MRKLLVELALAGCLALLLTLGTALGCTARGAEARGLEAFNITVYPQWLKLSQIQASGTSFTFTFESTAPEPMSLEEVAAQLECTACTLENVSLEVYAGGSNLHAPVEIAGSGPRVAAAVRNLDLALSEGQQVVITARYTPAAGAAALAARRLNVTCTLTLDGYRVPGGLAQYQVNTSLAAEARGQGVLLEVAARITIEGNESLKLKLDEHDPLLLCIDGASIQSASLEGGKGFTASTQGSCAAVAGQGALPLALNLTLRVAVGRQSTVIAVVPVSLRAGNTTLASKELRAEAGKTVTLQRLYGFLPYAYVVTTPEPLNATVTLRIGGETREVQLVNGEATLLLPEAFWPILTPLRLEAEKVAVSNPPAVFYAVQDQEEVVTPGLATLAITAAAAVGAAAAAALTPLRRRLRKPRIEDYIEEFTLE